MFEKLFENPDLDVELEDDEFNIDDLLENGVAHVDELCDVLAPDNESGTCDIQRKLWALHTDATRWVEDEVDIEDEILADTNVLLAELAEIRAHIETVESTLLKLKSCCDPEFEQDEEVTENVVG
nr:hypothetical protein [Pseudomonadales bacterium]